MVDSPNSSGAWTSSWLWVQVTRSTSSTSAVTPGTRARWARRSRTLSISAQSSAVTSMRRNALCWSSQSARHSKGWRRRCSQTSLPVYPRVRERAACWHAGSKGAWVTSSAVRPMSTSKRRWSCSACANCGLRWWRLSTTCWPRPSGPGSRSGTGAACWSLTNSDCCSRTRPSADLWFRWRGAYGSTTEVWSSQPRIRVICSAARLGQSSPPTRRCTYSGPSGPSRLGSCSKRSISARLSVPGWRPPAAASSCSRPAINDWPSGSTPHPGSLP